jgi:hypothetical protein
MKREPHIMHLTHRQSTVWFEDKELREKIKRTARSRSRNMDALPVYVLTDDDRVVLGLKVYPRQ